MTRTQSRGQLATPVREPNTRQAIYDAMAHLVYLNGYHGTPLRAVAEAVGIRMASLYHHYTDKQDLLVQIMERSLVDLTDSVRAAIGSCPPDDPEARLRAAILAHISFHATRREEAVVQDSEIRSLEKKNRRRIVALRDGYEALFAEILRDGRAMGVFIDFDERLALNALLGMCSQVEIWFRPGGRLSIAEVADGYSGLFLCGIKAHMKEGSHVFSDSQI